MIITFFPAFLLEIIFKLPAKQQTHKKHVYGRKIKTKN